MNPSPAAPLQTCLLAETVAVRRYAQLLEDEAAALTEAQAFDALGEITDGKNQIAAELATLGERRNAILADLGLASDHAGTDAAVVAHPELAPTWRTLLADVAQARELNQRNGTLLEVHMRHVQHSLDALRSVTGKTGLYDAQGRSATAPGAGKSIVAG